MKKLFYVIITACSLFAAAALCLVACKKDDNGGNGSADGNYWNIHNTVAKGIKTVIQDNVTFNFDKDGRLISQKTQYDETVYTYNSDGFPTKIVSKSFDDKGAVLSEATDTYEYGNKGKWTPVPMGPGNVMHIYMQGLYNGISKVTMSGTWYGDAVMTYTFNGNKLTISTTATEAQEPFEDIVFDYDGAYPVHLKRAPVGKGEFGEEIAMTYMANGMFDTYKECFLTDGIVYMERISTTNKNIKSVMSPDNEISKYWNLNYNEEGKALSQAELTRTETITYTYNEHGDVTSETTINSEANSEDYLTTYEYEYDSKGNWTKCTTTMTVTRPANVQEPRVFTQNRTIQYY